MRFCSSGVDGRQLEHEMFFPMYVVKDWVCKLLVASRERSRGRQELGCPYGVFWRFGVS